MFDLNQVPSQRGRVFIVTGANAGLGYETALALAKKGGQVVMACRNESKAEKARQQILAATPQAKVDIQLIDLSKLDSVRKAAAELLETYDRVDVLINNAGVMMPPYTQTEEGFELQMGANYFGHFLLTGLLLDRIVATPDSRIISLASLAHKRGNIQFDDLHWEQKYSPMGAYGQSKLACLIFSLELQRRLEQGGHQTLSLSAHPGVSPTELARHMPGWATILMKILEPFMTHSVKSGAQPTLMAALDPAVFGAEYLGPTGFQEMKGRAGRASISDHAKDETVAKQLWAVSEKLTGIQYP